MRNDRTGLLITIGKREGGETPTFGVPGRRDVDDNRQSKEIYKTTIDKESAEGEQ